ncbi:MAG: isoprenylcysteine carboxylmethyltransferase family protein [Pseudomonadota bacterium]
MSEDHANVAFFPPLGFAAVLAVITVLHWLLPLSLPGAFAAVGAALGVVFCLVAGALGATAILAFRRAGTHVEPHKPTRAIVRGGVYRVSRNPMYLGLVLLTLGVGLWFGTVWAFPGAFALWFALDRGVVAREEAYLTAKFGETYTALLDESRRWI